MKRIPEYDSDRCSVWLEQNGDVFISVHGTDSVGDVVEDTKLMAGGTVESPDVEALVRKLLDEGRKVDMGGHSLGTQYITNLPEDLLARLDEVYLFNPASSPTQSSDYLKRVLAMENTYWFVNPSDPVSSGLYNKMSNEFINNNQVYLGDYKFSALAAHSIGQWSKDLESQDAAEVAENYQNTSRDREKNPEESYRAHLKYLSAIQDAARQEASLAEPVSPTSP